MKNKIAFITPIYLPANLSGSSIIVKEIAEYLVKSGYDVSIITSNALTGRYWYDPVFGKKINKKSEVINGVKVYRLSCNQLISSICFIIVKKLFFLIPVKILNRLKVIYNGPYFIGVGKILTEGNFDIVHCSPFPLNINRQVVKAIDKLRKKPKLILSPLLHVKLKEFKNPELYPILLKADKIHVVTESEKKFLKSTFKISGDRIITIPLFLDLNKFSRLEELKKDVKKFKDKYKLNNKKIVLFAGNKGYMKGAITLLTAIDGLYKEDQSYRLIVIGNNMPEWTKVKKRVNPNFLLDFKYVDEKTKEIIFASCDVFCMPSISESFGLTYLEAWHKKKPIIAAEIPTSKEIIGLVNGGLLVRFGDLDDLKTKIDEIFRNKFKSKKMGENGFLALNNKYSFDKLYAKYKTLFDI